MGGYKLTAPPAEIRLGKVVFALGEPLFDDPGYCEKHASPETNGPCVHHADCSLRGLWHTLDRYMRHILDQVTLADLLEHEIPVLRELQAKLPVAAPRLQLLSLSGS
jgi:DNA-binding IscR family transcriptional regulator